jgi:hypothetical protein
VIDLRDEAPEEEKEEALEIPSQLEPSQQEDPS